MSTNFYFQSGNTSGTTSEQRLIEDLIVESLKIYGHDLNYMPRTLVNEDKIFDEDTLSKFTQSYPLEMYLENVNGYDGDDLFTKFGIEIRDQATFVVSRRRWEEMVFTSGGDFQLDTRPAEGDLLYFGKTRSIFEIKQVQFADPFYQAGKLYVYKLVCELFEYSTEIIQTGVEGADRVYEEENIDLLVHQILLEDGSVLLLEDGSSLINETYSEDTTTGRTDAGDFQDFNDVEDILDFSEINPFGEIG